MNGTSIEQSRIATQLLNALNEDDLTPINLALRCLSEIVEETNLTTQVKMLSALSNRLHQLTHSLSWKDSGELIRYIAKIFRKIATRASECKLADIIPKDENDILVNSFAPFIGILLIKLPDHYQTTIDIFSNLSLLLEIIKFICIAFEGFPYLCDENESVLSSVTALCWKYLISLIEMKHLSPEELKVYETTSEEGDRISIDIFVILVFELLQICLHSGRDWNNRSMIGSTELVNLIRVLMRYIQLSSEQYEQACFFGNEFIAAEEDDTLELSLRHTGKIFLKSLSSSCFKELIESVLLIIETDLNDLHEVHSSSILPPEWILRLEAMMFTLSAVGRSIVKKYIKATKTDMSVSCSPAPFSKQRHGRHHGDAEGLTESDAIRLCQIIMTLVNRFYQDPTNSSRVSSDDISSFNSLSIVRGAISKLLTIYSPILVKFVSLQSVISTCISFSLLPSFNLDDPPLDTTLSEPLSSRLLHCRGFGEMLRFASKNYGAMTITQNADGNFVQATLECCIQLCSLCNDSTIHIPLEIITVVVNIVAQSYEAEYEFVTDGTISHPPGNYLSDEIITHLVRIGLTVWSLYCFDPFSLEMSKDMLFATLHASTFSAQSLTIFLDQFIPPVEHMIGELVGNQSNKTLSDLSIKLLADSISRSSLCSPYTSEAARRICLPTIQAMIRIMHFSTDVDGVIDVGEVLRSLIVLLSAKDFSVSFIPGDILEDLVGETLLCIRIIFTKLMEYNYLPAIGALCQLIIHFPNLTQSGGYQEYVQQTVNIILSLGKSNNHRNILTMGLIHIFNINPLLIAESLGHIKLNNTNETALQYLLEVWFELHPLLESPYSLTVSTNGLIELIRMYSLQGISSGFLIRVLRLLLETLPSVIRNESQTAQTVSIFLLISSLLICVPG